MNIVLTCPDIASITSTNYHEIVEKAMAWAAVERELIVEATNTDSVQLTTKEEINAYYDASKAKMEEVQRKTKAILDRAREVIVENHARELAALRNQYQ